MAYVRTAKHPKPEESSPAQSQAAKAVSKAEAVRTALAEGLESPSDIVRFVKARFGIDMPKQMVSAYKANEKRREQGHMAPQQKPQTTTAAKPAANGEPDLLGALEMIKPLVEQYGAAKVKRIVDLMG